MGRSLSRGPVTGPSCWCLPRSGSDCRSWSRPSQRRGGDGMRPSALPRERSPSPDRMAPAGMRPLSATALLTCSMTRRCVTSPAGRWKLDVRPRAQRQLAGLPEKIAAAAVEFITSPLLDSPRRVGHPRVMNTPGSIPPAAGLTGACVIGLTRAATRWSSWTFLTDPTPTAHERSAPVAGNWPLYRLIAGWSLRVTGSTPGRTHADPPKCYER